MTAFKTIDYDMFKKHPHNRELVRNNVDRLIKSIKTRDLLEFRPLTVDKHFRIIDGQHRLQAARELRIPVWYQVLDEVKVEDMHLLNNAQRQWSYDDYLNFFCQEGKIDYLRLRAFMNSHNLTLRQTLTVLNKKERGGNIKSEKPNGELKPFKSGLFVYPSEQEEKECLEIFHAIQKVQELIRTKTAGNCLYVKGTLFIRSLSVFFSIKAVNVDIFLGKIAYRLDLMHNCNSMANYLLMFKTIYNYRNSSNRIELDEFTGIA